MGTATAPGGHTLTVNTRNLLRDGKPWLPISGEFHFSRCPASDWRDELLKMKAGGVSIVATYIFWIHHEEERGKWDWTGQRNLRKFVEDARSAGLYVFLRIGPWAHGEARNGGFPDWLQEMGDRNQLRLRRDDPAYLAFVKELYRQIALQTRGLLWKDGGPVIGIQIENEYNEFAAGTVSHLVTLKRMAQAAGLDVPLYSRTGWGGAAGPPVSELLPFSGGYPDGFWDRSLQPMPGSYRGAFRFSGGRAANAAAMGDLNTGAAARSGAGAAAYPNFTCEVGGGMMSSYHRRLLISPRDIESLALVKLGSGVNLLGFYMYHGGVNPDGKLSYLNETQARNYWNDLPVKDYDFQAPLGSFGQERQHYHWLRLLGLFLQDWGAELTGMTPRLPEPRGTLNWAVRSDGDRGYIFVSNYQRLAPQPAQPGVQFRIRLADNREVVVPAAPITVPADARFFWPFNMKLGGANLLYATAQPATGLDVRDTHYTVFVETPGVPAEFLLDGEGVTVDASAGKVTAANGKIWLRDVRPGLGPALRFHTRDGNRQVVVLLDQPAAPALWKASWQGSERLFLTSAELLADGAALRLVADRPAAFSIAMLPAPATVSAGGTVLAPGNDGVFQRFAPAAAGPAAPQPVLETVQPAGALRTIPIAPSVATRKQGMAMQPEDADFARAAVWRVKLPSSVDLAADPILRIHYTGDVARVTLDGKLLEDDFYHGRPLEVGLRRFGPGVLKGALQIAVLPLEKGAPIYLADEAKPDFGIARGVARIARVEIVNRYELSFTTPPGAPPRSQKGRNPGSWDHQP